MSAQKRETQEVTVSASNIILDIEGTTTSISFVKDVLFPYVRKHLEAYTKQNLESGNFKSIVDALKNQAKEDTENKLEGVIAIPETEDTDALTKALVDNVLWQMDNDRKTKCLKDLQGVIYEEGYKKGDLKGHVYEDVVPCLKAWTEDERSVYIYSSGSVHAQKLLFGHSEKGDLLTYIKGHFDTTVGLKGDAQSYKKILEEISCSPSEAIFLTDVPKEAQAAKEAGILALLVTRDGNAPLTEEDSSGFQVISSFEEIKFEQNIKRRKLSSKDNDVNIEIENKKVVPCSESVNNETPEDPKQNGKEEKMDVDDENESSNKDSEISDKEAEGTKDSQESKISEETLSVEEKEVVEQVESVEAAKSDDSEMKTDGTKPVEVTKVINEKQETKTIDSSTDNKLDEKVLASNVEQTENEEKKEICNLDSAKPKVAEVTKSETHSEKVSESTVQPEENLECKTVVSSSVPEESNIQKSKEVPVEEAKESNVESKEVPVKEAKESKAESKEFVEESKIVSEKNSEVPIEKTVDDEDVTKKDSCKDTKVTEKEVKESSEEGKIPEKDGTEIVEVLEKKEGEKEAIPVSKEQKTNGVVHEDEIPNGKLSNGASPPSEKTNGHDEVLENGGEKSEASVKSEKKTLVSRAVPNVIES